MDYNFSFSFINICYAGIIVVLIPWLFNVHHHFEAYVYGLGMAFSGGAVIAINIWWKELWHKRGLLAYGGVLMSGIALLIMPFISWAPALIFLMAIEGFGMMIFGLIWETSLQELVPKKHSEEWQALICWVLLLYCH